MITSRRFPAGARTDDEHLRRVGVTVQVDDNEGMVGGVEEVVVGDPVAPRRPMYLTRPHRNT